jgi:transposase, IS5 family
MAWSGTIGPSLLLLFLHILLLSRQTLASEKSACIQAFRAWPGETSSEAVESDTKKGKQWYFGMKAHVGVDSKTKIIHTAVATAATVSDAAILPDLLHGAETRVWGDGAYQGQTDLIRERVPRAQDFTQRRCRHKGQIVDEVAWAKNRTKSKVRAKVEHVFQVMKLKFGFVKVRDRGLEKYAHRLFVTCALVNLFVSRKKLILSAA